MIHKQELHLLQPSGKSSIAEIEIAFTTIKFEIHTYVLLLYEIVKRKV